MFDRRPTPLHRWVVASVPETEETFEGVLVESDEQWHVLEQARQIVVEGENARRVAVDGRLWLDRLAVPYLQEPDPAAGPRR